MKRPDAFGRRWPLSVNIAEACIFCYGYIENKIWSPGDKANMHPCRGIKEPTLFTLHGKGMNHLFTSSLVMDKMNSLVWQLV